VSVSKKWISDPKNIRQVLEKYKTSELKTAYQIAEELGTSYHNVYHTLRNNIPMEERKALKAIRLSAGKLKEKNPMWGKMEQQHPNWKGECSDHKGYVTRMHNGKRTFVHQIVIMEALGLSEFPKGMVVHHINGDRLNNNLDNLALTTNIGHRKIHALQNPDTKALKSQKLKLAAAIRFMTSP
jgi:HNH endonuclease